MCAQSPTFRLGQRPCLDGLRGLAAVAVLAAHLGLIPGGVVGVDVLFVLSGFLITVLLVEEWHKTGTISLSTFYRKRFLRVLPPLAVLLVLGGAASIVLGLGTPRSVAREGVLALTFVSNWHTLHQVAMPTFGHTWTLSLEVQFYLIWPVMLVLLLRAGVGRQRILTFVLLGIIASAALRVGLFTLLPLSRAEKRTYTMRLFMGLDTHADTLLLGCLAGLVVAWGVFPQTAGWRRGLHVAGWLSLAGLATMLMRSHHEQYSYYYGLAVVLALMAAILLVWWMVAPPCILKFFELSPLVGLGRISYALYLFHMPLVQFCRPMRASWGVAKTSLVVISVSLLLAILSYYLIERPVLSLRHRRQGLRPVADDVPARAA